MSKPSVYFPLARPMYGKSVEQVVRVFEAAGHKCSHTDEGQDIMIGSDAGDTSTAKLQFNLNHGFGAKNIYWGTDGVEREKDKIQLVPSKWYKKVYARNGVEAEVVGMPRLDEAFKTRSDKERTVLYAPTCHMELTSIPMIDARVLRLSGYGWRVRVKLHPSICEVEEQWKNAKSIYGDGHLETEDSGILTARARIVVCDMATTLLDAIVLDRPAIVMQTSVYLGCRYFSYRNPEWVFANCQYRAFNWYEAKERFKLLMHKDDPLAERRRRAAPFICEYRGEAASRVYDAVMRHWGK